MHWELDWAREGSTGTRVWCRHVGSPRKDSRRWRLRLTGYLRKHGASTPTYRVDSWEVDWSKRKPKFVWARNIRSKIPSARSWHWVDYGLVKKAGIKWKPLKVRTGRFLQGGYVILTRRGMTQQDVEFSERCGLFRGVRKAFLREHHLVMAKKIGGPLPAGFVIRHMNGIKSDNAEDNLVLGTQAENAADHNTARMMAMFWRGKYEEGCKRFGIEV
jgi:hypothetical protein